MKNNMSTKFVSKNSNYMLVLERGIPASPVTGTPAKHGIYIKFVDGFVDIKDEKISELMKANEKCGVDFIEVKDDELHPSGRRAEIDPFADSREEIEPAHIVSEVKYGHLEKAVSTKKNKIPPAVKKLIMLEAQKLAREMLPGMVKDTVKALVEQAKSEKSVKTETPEKSEE